MAKYCVCLLAKDEVTASMICRDLDPPYDYSVEGLCGYPPCLWCGHSKECHTNMGLRFELIGPDPDSMDAIIFPLTDTVQIKVYTSEEWKQRPGAEPED